MSSMSAFVASAGIMIWIGSPESRTSAKTTTDTTKIETIDWITRPTMKRCIGASALEELDGLGQGHQEDAAALARRRVLAVGRRVEIVAGLQVPAADGEIALDDEDLLAGRMVVGWKARAGLEPYERGGAAGLLVVAEHLDRRAAHGQGAPAELVAAQRRWGTTRLGHAQGRPQSRFVAILAPSTSASNLAHTTLGWISVEPANVAKPQSAPAMTFSRPTAWANRTIRSATGSGCSPRTVDCVSVPGIATARSGSFTVSHTRHSCSWRGLAASNE